MSGKGDPDEGVGVGGGNVKAGISDEMKQFRRSQWLEYPRQREDWQELAGTKPGRVLLAVLFTS